MEVQTSWIPVETPPKEEMKHVFLKYRDREDRDGQLQAYP